MLTTTHRNRFALLVICLLMATAQTMHVTHAFEFKKKQVVLAPAEIQMVQSFEYNDSFYPDWSSETSEAETQRLTNEIMASKDSDANLYLNRAYARLNTTDKAGALADYNKAIELDNTLVDAYYYRGELYKEMGNTHAAIQDYSRVIALDPAYSSVHAYRAELYEKMGEYSKAIADYSTDITNYDSYSDSYLKRGQLYEKIGNPQAALNDYNKCLTLDDEYTHAYYLRGNLFAKQGDTEKALRDYSSVLKNEPTSDATLTQRGLLYYTRGDFKKAMKDLQLAVESNPENANAYTLLSLIKGLHMEDREGGMADVKQAQQLFKNQGHEDRYKKALEAEALIATPASN